MSGPIVGSSEILHNKLTVGEALHLHRTEGGPITSGQLAFQFVMTLAIFGLLAKAIFSVNTTVWHVFLPIVAEYLAYVLALPVIQAVVRHVDLKHPAIACLRLVALYLAALAGIVIYRAISMEHTWLEQGRADWHVCWNWVIDSQVHWSILLAAVYSAINTWKSVSKLRQFGPPFLGPGMGCAMRMVVLILAIVIVPVFVVILLPFLQFIGLRWTPAWNASTIVWLLFGLLLISELMTIWFPWDIQRRLAKAGKLPTAE